MQHYADTMKLVAGVPWWSIISIIIIVIFFGVPLNTRLTSERRLTGVHTFQTNNQTFVKELQAKHLPLFHVSDPIVIIGPTVFPKPTHLLEVANESTVVPLLQPIHGHHRSSQQAVFTFAAEYALPNYILFLTSLKEHFDGDVVIAVSSMDWEDHVIREYLQHQDHVIVYLVSYQCFNAEGQSVNTTKGGARVCLCPNLYGTTIQTKKNTGSHLVLPLPDPRHPRSVQTSRYELYWIWSQSYSPTSWILLIDFRDTIFQVNPFLKIPSDGKSTLLFFGENTEATRLGQSKYNRYWLESAYGNDAREALEDKPTLCSGATMGSQPAMDQYLRAMVAESDETTLGENGEDQAFHNYLYYSNKLAQANDIFRIIVQNQGMGIVNNLGALRTKELNDWGNGQIFETVKDSKDKVIAHNIRNWDGTLSAVVHQFDRHKVLGKWWYRTKTAEYRKQWNDKREKKQHNRSIQ